VVAALRAELPQVVIRVQVGQAEPLGVGQRAEDRMRWPLEAAAGRRDAVQQRLGLREVSGKVAGPRAALLLVELRARQIPWPAQARTGRTT
jgi:hypothetical protein